MCTSEMMIFPENKPETRGRGGGGNGGGGRTFVRTTLIRVKQTK